MSSCSTSSASAGPNSELLNRSGRLLVMGGWTEDVHVLLIPGLVGLQREGSSMSNKFIEKWK